MSTLFTISRMTSAASESHMQHAPESNITCFKGGLIDQRSGGTHVSIDKWETEQVIAERCKRDDLAIIAIARTRIADSA